MAVSSRSISSAPCMLPMMKRGIVSPINSAHRNSGSCCGGADWTSCPSSTTFWWAKCLLLVRDLFCRSTTRQEEQHRLVVRPGLTGWAQVNGGRELSPEDKAALDLWYIQNMSLALDFRIALRTCAVVIAGERVEREAVLTAREAIARLERGQSVARHLATVRRIVPDGENQAAAVSAA